MSHAKDTTSQDQPKSRLGTLLAAAEAAAEFQLLQEDFSLCGHLAWAGASIAAEGDEGQRLKILVERVAILVPWLLGERYPRLFSDWPEPASSWVMRALLDTLMEPQESRRSWQTFLRGLERHSVLYRPGEAIHGVRTCKGAVELTAFARDELEREQNGGRLFTYRLAASDDWAPAKRVARAVEEEVNRDESARPPGRRGEGSLPAYRQRVLLFNVYDEFRRRWPIPCVPWDNNNLRINFVRAIRDRDRSVNVEGIWPSVPSDTAITKLLTVAREWLAPDDPMAADKYLSYHLLARRLEHL